MGDEPTSPYQIPANYSQLSRADKTVVTIQNLYLNHGWGEDRIAGLLDLEEALVRRVLVECGHLADDLRQLPPAQAAREKGAAPWRVRFSRPGPNKGADDPALDTGLPSGASKTSYG